MDLTFDDELELFKRSARKFAETRCGKSVIQEMEASDAGFSPDLWRGMAELGWMGTMIPEAYDGLGCTLMEQAVLFEEIGRAALPGPMLCTLTGTLAVMEGGSEAQKSDLLPRVAAGELILTTAVEEPEAHYDPTQLALRAVSGKDGYVLDGTKAFVPYATMADLILVAGRTRGAPGDEEGVSLFLVDRDAPGVRCSPMKTISGDRQFQVDFQGVKVAGDRVLGRPDESLSLLKVVRDKAAALQCVEMAGGAQKQLDLTSEYIKIREQFGRPIGTFQAVQHRAADMYTDVLGARLAAYKAVWCLSRGLPAEQELLIARTFTGQASRRVSFSAQHLHGGIGFTLEYDLQFYYRRAKALELRLGPPDLHLRRLGAAL